jgi:uncharacterized protein YndB with AHSA1/START domain
MTNTPSTDQELGELTVTRDFDAPRELVFKAFVDPQQLIRFWGPVGTHVPIDRVVIEPWAGGRFETLMVADDGSGEFLMQGAFIEVVEPEIFSFGEPGGGMTTTSTLTDLGDGRTRVIIHQTNVSAMYLTPEAQEGFNSSLDRLERYLAEVQARLDS